MTRSKSNQQINIIADLTTAVDRGTAQTLVIKAGETVKISTSDTANSGFEEIATITAPDEDGNYVQSAIALDGAKKYVKANKSVFAVLGDYAIEPVAPTAEEVPST